MSHSMSVLCILTTKQHLVPHTALYRGRRSPRRANTWPKVTRRSRPGTWQEAHPPPGSALLRGGSPRGQSQPLLAPPGAAFPTRLWLVTGYCSLHPLVSQGRPSFSARRGLLGRSSPEKTHSLSCGCEGALWPPASSPKPCWPRLKRAPEARRDHSIAPLSTPNPEGALSLRPLVAPRSFSPACAEAEVPVTGSIPGTTHQETGSDAVQLRGKRALAAEDAGAAGRRA